MAAAMSPTRAGSFGNTAPLKRTVSRKGARYATPAPGQYDAGDIAKVTTRFRSSQQPSFGGNMAKIDRPSTGYLAGSLRFRAPGPGNYNHDSALDKQPLSKRATAVRPKFAKAPRDDAAKVYMPGSKQVGSALKNPGPDAYANVVTQDHISRGSKKKRAPATSFGGNLGQMKRPGLGYMTGTPKQCGPGTYSIGDGLGKQASSRKTTAPRAKFGTADRQKSQMALAPGYKAPASQARHNPGAGAYQHRSGLGLQSDAKKPSAAQYSFGKEARGAAPRNEVPGPGQYSNNPGMGAQVNSRFRTSNRTQFGTSERQSLATHVG
eukprot:g3264.t1